MKKLVASVVLTASLSTMLLVPAFAENTATGPYSTYDARTGYGANAVTNPTTAYGTTTYRAPGTATAPGMTTYDTTRVNNVHARATTTTRNVDWGWLGLLGLIGLAGLRGRNRERDRA